MQRYKKTTTAIKKVKGCDLGATLAQLPSSSKKSSPAKPPP